MYLLREVSRKKKRPRPAVAHIWDGADTRCRMYSTGGLKPKRYRVSATTEGRPICNMCTLSERLDEQLRDAIARDT